MSEKQTYTLTVNGQPRQVMAEPASLLMDVLRDDLRLTGVKDGCATGHCGSCMVIKDGEAVRSCLVPMKRVEGRRSTTIEGVAGPDGRLHPVQQAYIDQGATQCGFCTPGFIMATIALLEKNPNPTLEEIYDGAQWNICRCTGHNAIIRAIQQAAGQSVPPLPAVKQPLNAISRPLPRPDAVEKVTGKGIYADDLYVEGMLHARALRSQYPHARLLQGGCEQGEERFRVWSPCSRPTTFRAARIAACTRLIGRCCATTRCATWATRSRWSWPSRKRSRRRRWS